MLWSDPIPVDSNDYPLDERDGVEKVAQLGLFQKVADDEATRPLNFYAQLALMGAPNCGSELLMKELIEIRAEAVPERFAIARRLPLEGDRPGHSAVRLVVRCSASGVVYRRILAMRWT